MTDTAKRHMVLRMTVNPEDGEPFSTTGDAEDFADCKLRGFGFRTVVIGGRIVLFKPNGGYFYSIGFEPCRPPSQSNPS